MVIDVLKGKMVVEMLMKPWKLISIFIVINIIWGGIVYVQGGANAQPNQQIAEYKATIEAQNKQIAELTETLKNIERRMAVRDAEEERGRANLEAAIEGAINSPVPNTSIKRDSMW